MAGAGRIYLRNAGVWILDEPTSAVDAEADREIFAELRRTRHTRITIVVSHRASTLMEMDRIYVIDHGSVVQQGTYPELMSQPDWFARLFASRTRYDGSQQTGGREDDCHEQPLVGTSEMVTTVGKVVLMTRKIAGVEESNLCQRAWSSGSGRAIRRTR